MSESEATSIEVGKYSSVFVWNEDGSTQIYLPDDTDTGEHYFELNSSEYYAAAIALLYADLKDPVAAGMRNVVFDELQDFFLYMVNESEAQERRKSFRLVAPPTELNEPEEEEGTN